jgi:hypothetical protein
MKRHPEVARLLLEAGAPVNCFDEVRHWLAAANGIRYAEPKRRKSLF